MLRIAMWSGPRNISTAMMRSWGNRPDTFVCDEPLYAHYLQATGVSHPGADEVMQHQETDWRKVVNHLIEFEAPGKSIYYQKHMTHHLLPDIDRSWLDRLQNCFLIRDPREVITSYVKKNPHIELADTGFPQQSDIFRWVRARTGMTPPVVDARDVLSDPRRTLGLLCDALRIDFRESMLEWPPGLRDSDGVWAKYWYHEVEKSTSFQPYRPKSDRVPEPLQPMLAQCAVFYEELYRYRIC
jgi:hypothetical protein